MKRHFTVCAASAAIGSVDLFVPNSECGGPRDQSRTEYSFNAHRQQVDRGRGPGGEGATGRAEGDLAAPPNICDRPSQSTPITRLPIGNRAR